MVELQITLPSKAGKFVNRQIASGRYCTSSEVLNAIVEEARVREAKAKLAALLEGMESGSPIMVTDERLRQQRANLTSTLPPGSDR